VTVTSSPSLLGIASGGPAPISDGMTLGCILADRMKSLGADPRPELSGSLDAVGCGQRRTFSAALFDRCGGFRPFLSPDNAGDHRLYESAGKARPAVEAEAVTLDSVFRDRPGKVDFIKVDVQGSEGAVLEGMAGLLGWLPQVKMTLEFWPL
jgi:FkbM family methyltransferase